MASTSNAFSARDPCIFQLPETVLRPIGLRPLCQIERWMTVGMGGCSGARMISAPPASRNALFSPCPRGRVAAAGPLRDGLPDPPRQFVRTAAYFGGIAGLAAH